MGNPSSDLERSDASTFPNSKIQRACGHASDNAELKTQSEGIKHDSREILECPASDDKHLRSDEFDNRVKAASDHLSKETKTVAPSVQMSVSTFEHSKATEIPALPPKSNLTSSRSNKKDEKLSVEKAKTPNWNGAKTRTDKTNVSAKKTLLSEGSANCNEKTTLSTSSEDEKETPSRNLSVQGKPEEEESGTCEICKKKHDGSYGTGRYCSKECRYALTGRKKTSDQIITGVDNDPKDTKVGPRGPKERRRSGRRTTKLDNSQKHTSRRKKSLRSSSKVDNGPRDTSRKKKSGRGATEVDSSPKDTSRKKTSGRSTKVDKSPKDIRRKTISGCSLTDVDDGPNDTKCEVCNTLHNGSYGTGRYCSKECRYTRTRCTKRAMEQKNGMHKQQKTKETRGNESRSKRVRQKTEFYSPGYPRVKSKLTLVVEDILRSKSAKKSKLDKEDKVCRKDKDARMKSGLRRSGRSKADLKKEPRQDEKDISLGTKCNRRGIATRSNSTEIFDERKIKTHKSRSAVAKEIHSGVKPGFKRRPRRPLTTSTKKTKTTDGSKENDSGERRSRPQEKVKSKPLPSSSRKSKAHHNSYKRPTTVDPKTLPNKKLTWNQFQRIHLGKPNMTLAWKEYLQDKRLCGQFAKAEAITFNEYEIRRMKKQKEATRDEYEIYCYLVSYYNTNNDEKKETLHVKRKSSDFPRTIESSEKRARICRRDSNASKRSDTSELRKLGRDQREVSKKKDQQSGASTFESAKIGPSLSLQELGEKENPKRSLVEEQSSSRQGSPQSDAEKNRRGGRVDKPGVTAALPPSINPPQPSQIFSKQFSSGTKNGKACLFPKTDSRTALSTSWVHNIEAHEPPGPTINVGASHSENGEISCHEVDAKSIEPLMKTGSTNSQIDLAPRGDNQNEDVQPGSVMNADAKTASSNNTISANDREESSKATKPDLEHIQPSSKDNNACRVLAVAEMLFQAKTIPEMVHAASVVPGILSAGSEVVESRSEHGPKIAPTTNNSTRSGSQLTHEPPLNRKPRTSVLPEGRHPQSQPSTGNSETVMKTLMPQSQSVPATAFRTTAKNVVYPATAHNHIMPTQVKLSVGSLGTKEMMPKPKASKSAAQDSAVHVSKSSARVARQPVVQRIVGMFKQTEVPEVAVAARQVEITALKSAKAKPVPFMQEETRSVPGPASKSVESTVVPMAPLRVPAKTLKAKQRPEAKSTPMCQTIQAVNRMPMEKPMKRSMSVAKGAQAMNHRLVALPTQVVAKQTVAKPTGGGKQAAGAGLTSPTIATKQTHACPKMTPKLAPSKPENSKHMSHASVRGTPIHERNVGVDTNFIKGGPNSIQDRRKRNFPHVTNPYPNFNSPCRSCTSIPIIPPRNVQNAGPHFINTICWPSSSFHSSQNPTSAFHNSLQTLSISSVVPQSPALFRSQPQIHSHLIPSPTPPSMINHLIPPPATVGAVGAPRNPRSILEGRNHSFNNGQKRAAVWQNPWQGYAEPVCPRPDVHALPLHGSTTQVSGTQFRKGANVHSQRSVPSQRSPAHDRV
uniref:Uncharacterized protein n=1 Tax=Lotharella globosa TaxID=91324 RepID=A0A7S4DFZ7_9EUKA